MRFAPLVFAVPLALSASVASAQPLPSIDARTWRPSTDPSGGLVLEPTTTPGPWNWNVGAFLSYAYRPISLTVNGETLRPVESLLGMDLVGSLGIGSRFALGASLPMALYQSGTGTLPTTVSSSGQVPETALGDLAINGKATLISDAQGGFGLAAQATLTVPTGDPGSFMGEDAFTVGGRLIAEYTLLIASVQGSLGYTGRPDQRTWPDPSVGGIVYGNTIPWSVVFALKPAMLKMDKEHRQRWELGVHGWLPGGPVAPFGGTGAGQESPALLSLADRMEIGHYRDAYLLAGVEIGLTNAVGTPIFRGVLGIGWAPRNHDMDNDGVPDDVDQCPELPEDKDGFEDSDGCPEIDNDDDGILDKDDACPNVPGVPSSDPKKNGCPQPDRDKDGVPDSDDACPDQKGFERDDPKTNGCPLAGDRDKDGIPDNLDRCPDQPEDKDGFEDDDGCPDPDDDGDGIADVQDACPREPGVASTDPKLNGCPNRDRDGDTFDDGVDNCPDEPEVFNGVKDDDGCPDTGGRPLVTIVEGADHRPHLNIAAGDKLALDGATVRAIVLEANHHREWSFLVAANGAKPEAALARAAELADDLDKLAHREVAEAVAWDQVKKEPATTGDVKIIILVAEKKEATPPPPPLPQVPKP